MPRRQPAQLEFDPSADAEPPAGPSILVAGDRLVAARISSLAGSLHHARSAAQADALLGEHAPEVAIIGDDLPGAMDLIRRRAADSPRTSIILLSANPTLDTALAAIRAGAVDVVDASAPAAELIPRVRAAAARAGRARADERKIQRLRRVCRQLNGARHEITRQVGGLCSDLTAAYDQLAEEMVRASAAGEFAALVRQELDVESLLRTVLEFILARIGTTNAAVFLPSSCRDFALGAYVNCDRPKDTVDVLLDHLANAVAPKMEDEDRVLCYRPGRSLDALLGEDAPWMCGSNVVLFSCRHEDECLAVVALFREQPFDPEAVRIIEAIAPLMARQLGKVVHIHHRHLPREQWGAFDESADEDDYGLAA